jgi:hypothetical protein
MSALLPILLCGGGMALCWLIMSKMRRRSDDADSMK